MTTVGEHIQSTDEAICQNIASLVDRRDSGPRCSGDHATAQNEKVRLIALSRWSTAPWTTLTA